MTRPPPVAVAAALLLAAGGGCAATFERGSEADFAEARRALAPAGEPSPHSGGELDGSLEGYLSAAMRRSPALRAAFERWRAALERTPQARRLPEPMLTYTYFVRSVETRVGPQRHRVGLVQTFPWPTKLTAGADAAAAAARAEQRRFEAFRLALVREVVEAWTGLWRLERIRAIEEDQVVALEALSAMTRGRLAVGGASLADLQQIDLAAARRRDRVSSLDEDARAARARLAWLAAESPARTIASVTGEPPPPGLPAEPDELVADAVRHPQVRALEMMEASGAARARAASADRLPGLSLGVDWVETGEARHAPDVEDSGRDAVMVMVGLRLPLWQHVYRAQVDEARAEARAVAAEADDARLRAEAEVQTSLAAVRDADRRIRLYGTTLVAQAETAHASLLGAYQTGDASAMDAIRGQSELLELQRGLVEARAQHAVAWARLEQTVGRPVERAPEVEPQ